MEARRPSRAQVNFAVRQPFYTLFEENKKCYAKA